MKKKRKLMIISGTSLPAWSNNRNFDLVFRKLTGSKTSKFLLPPHSTNPTENGVPKLWKSAVAFDNKIHTSVHDVAYQHRKCFSSSLTAANETVKLKNCLHDSWHTSSEKKNKKTNNAETYFNDAARTKVGSITLQQILMPLCADHLYATNKLHGPRQHPKPYDVTELADERLYLRSVTAPNPFVKPSCFKKPKSAPPTLKQPQESGYRMIKLQNRLEFLDRNMKNTNELIERGLNITKSVQPVINDRKPYSRTSSAASRRLISSATSFSRRSDYDIISPDISLLATGVSATMHVAESSSPSGFLKSTHSRIRPGNLSRCLRASPEDIKKRPTWRF